MLIRAALAALVALALASTEAGARPRAQEAAQGPKPVVKTDAKSIATFTPSLIDAPGLPLKSGQTSAAHQFRFTPSGEAQRTPDLTVGVRARSVPQPVAGRLSETPAGYDVGLSVGTRGVSVLGDVKRLDAGLVQREAVTLGLGYGRKDWSTTLRLGEEDGWVRGAALPIDDKRYSVELGGAYAVGGQVKLGAGVRYRMNADSDATPRQPTDRSAFLGLGISF